MTADALRIDAVGPVHAEALALLSAAAFGEDSWSADAIASALRQTSARGLSAETEEGPAGFLIWRALGPEAELLTIGVAPDARRRGVGGALMEKMLADAADAGCGRLHLEVAENNFAARPFYECFAFKVTGLRKRYYRNGDDAISMSVDLEPS